MICSRIVPSGHVPGTNPSLVSSALNIRYQPFFSGGSSRQSKLPFILFNYLVGLMVEVETFFGVRAFI